jgi:hypothetical protein
MAPVMVACAAKKTTDMHHEQCVSAELLQEGEVHADTLLSTLIPLPPEIQAYRAGWVQQAAGSNSCSYSCVC